MHYLPACAVEHVYLVARAVWVREYESWANDVERAIDVHGVGVFEGQGVYPDTLLGKMAPHPFYTHEVGDLARKKKKDVEVPSRVMERGGILHE